MNDEQKLNLIYYFSNSSISPEKELTRIIDNATETIDMAVYYFTETKLLLTYATQRKEG